MAHTHSKLPWRLRFHPADDTRFIIEADKNSHTHPYNIEVMADDSGGDLYPTEQKLADAELIVRAVNAHDALVDALTEARKWIDGQPARSTCKYTTQFELEEAIDAALARDGGTK
jgi:hypothetical protein